MLIIPLIMFMKNFEKLMNKLFILFLIFTNILFPQKFYLSQTIGTFENASSFWIVPNGFIYITDKDKDEVIQLDTSGNVLKDVGGFGWNQSQFDEPADVFADPLSVYVADKNNHRIQRFDRNLNFISELYTRDKDNPDQSFGYPISCAVSNQGDLFVLDSENKRILKFDLFGNFKLQLGGIDAGQFALFNPISMSIGASGIVFVADQKSILTFDQFGNGITKIVFDEEIISLRILFDKITVVLKNKILFASISDENIEFHNLLFENNMNEKIVSSILFNNKLYILTPKQILIYVPSLQ